MGAQLFFGLGFCLGGREACLFLMFFCFGVGFLFFSFGREVEGNSNIQ